jgi:hypothetical protein
MEAVCERRDDISKHMAGAWKAMQQQERLTIARTCLPVEDIKPVNIGFLVANLSHLASPSNS